jgi:hypothetical protein
MQYLSEKESSETDEPITRDNIEHKSAAAKLHSLNAPKPKYIRNKAGGKVQPSGIATSEIPVAGYHETGSRLHRAVSSAALRLAKEHKKGHTVSPEYNRLRHLAISHQTYADLHDQSTADHKKKRDNRDNPAGNDPTDESIVGVPMGFQKRMEIKIILESYQAHIISGGLWR